MVRVEPNSPSRDDKSSIAPIITTTVQKIMPTIPPPISHTPMLNKTDRSIIVDVSGIATEFTPTRTEPTTTTIKMDKIMPQTPSATTAKKSNGFRSLINLNIFLIFIFFNFFSYFNF